MENYLGNKKLGDFKHKVVVTAYNATRNDLKRFRNFPIRGFDGDCHLLASTVAQATSAAPTYFEGIKIPECNDFDGNGAFTIYLDGGICVNSPVLVGITEALCHFNISRDKLKMLSVGTLYEKFRKGELNSNGGYRHWWDDSVGVLMQGQQAAAVNLVEDLIPADQFVRVTKELPEGEKFEIDDTSKIKTLIELGKRAVYERKNGEIYLDKIERLFFQEEKEMLV